MPPEPICMERTEEQETREVRLAVPYDRLISSTLCVLQIVGSRRVMRRVPLRRILDLGIPTSTCTRWLSRLAKKKI